jgi:hypothetical protein
MKGLKKSCLISEDTPMRMLFYYAYLESGD